MRRRLPPDLAQLGEGEVMELALDPDERTLVVDGHHFRVEPPAERQTERMWRVRGPVPQQPFETDWEVEVRLGELTEGDMVAVVRSGLGTV